MEGKKDIRVQSQEDINAFFIEIGEKAFRAKQVYQWLWEKVFSRGIRFFPLRLKSFFVMYYTPLLKKILEERNSAYRGSVLHFMRALSKNKLNDRGYKVYLANGMSDPSKIIFLSQLKNGKGVFVKIKGDGDLNIIYKNGNQSRIEVLDNEFYIDSFGNHLPPLSIQFYGDLGGQRVGDTVPLDFTSIKE